MHNRKSSDNTQEIENQEWVDSLRWVIENESRERAKELLELLSHEVVGNGQKSMPRQKRHEYVNTISAAEETPYPGSLDLEERIQNAIRWNAMAMIVKANKEHDGIGGHISTYSSASTLFEVGFNHFFRGYDEGEPDVVYFQGHASPGIYARSFLEHRLSEKDLIGFRREISGHGLPSYPHPRCLPGYWRYPTVSMGLAPIQAVYQARFLKYIENREMVKSSDQKVWTFIGDGEMDEPESTAALTIAALEKLNNLIFVINCNLQRLDGPVRGNSKIVSELEGLFEGAGWNVIKVLWDGNWDRLFEKDDGGILKRKLAEIPDGELQRWAQLDGGKLRESFFNKEGELKKIADQFSDGELGELKRGGHDAVKVFNAYHRAISSDRPVVILAQTVKGFGQGEAGEASNVTHQQKKFSFDQLKSFRDRLEIPIADNDLQNDLPFYRFDEDTDEYKYLADRRKKLSGWLPERKNLAKDFRMPAPKVFESYFDGSNNKAVSLTSAFVQMLSKLLKDEQVGKFVVPIIPDESRTFGMDALFSQVGIYSSRGQQYEPVDKGSLLYYNESKQGVILEEGITEAGSMASFIAAGNNHLVQDFYTIPFFVFYSMFGFQRIGDLIWAALDSGTKGFLVGGISGRTSLSGEGLQHADGQSHLYAMAYPNLQAYDPAFAYELAVIIEDGLKRMYDKGENIFFYITVTNQAYTMPAMPENAREGILKGMYLLQKSRKRKNKEKTVNLMGSGAIMVEVQQAAALLEEEFELPVNIWSVTSYKALYENGRDVERHNLISQDKKLNFLQQSLEDRGEVFVAASDYVKAVPLIVSKWIPGSYTVLGTDGFGRSDTVSTLREYFEVDAHHIAWSALTGLHRQNALDKNVLQDFQQRYPIKEKINPAHY